MEQILTTSVAGVSLTDWMGNFVGEARGLIIAILSIAGVVIAVMIIIKNPTVGRVIVGVLVGGFVAGLPWIIPAAGEMVRGDINASAQDHYSVTQEASQANIQDARALPKS